MAYFKHFRSMRRISFPNTFSHSGRIKKRKQGAKEEGLRKETYNQTEVNLYFSKNGDLRELTFLFFAQYFQIIAT